MERKLFYPSGYPLLISNGHSGFVYYEDNSIACKWDTSGGLLSGTAWYKNRKISATWNSYVGVHCKGEAFYDDGKIAISYDEFKLHLYEKVGENKLSGKYWKSPIVTLRLSDKIKIIGFKDTEKFTFSIEGQTIHEINKQ
jgi:hypothetical protein